MPQHTTKAYNIDDMADIRRQGAKVHPRTVILITATLEAGSLFSHGEENRAFELLHSYLTPAESDAIAGDNDNHLGAGIMERRAQLDVARANGHLHAFIHASQLANEKAYTE